MDINHLFIIGNGFDKGEHNMPTAYINYRNYLIERFPDALKHNSVPEKGLTFDKSFEYDSSDLAGYIIYILDNCDDGTWGALEEYLGDDIFSLFIYELDEITNDSTDKELKHSFYNNEDISTNICNTFKMVKPLFCEWIIDYYRNFKYGFEGLFKNLRSYLYNPNIAKVLSEADYFITFNYTLTLEKVYEVDPNIICHIHGDVNDDSRDIYFGHGDDHGFPEMFKYMGADYKFDELKRFLRKDTFEAYLKHSSVFDKINNQLEDIHSFGFSFSDVDLYYIEKISERIDLSKVTWFINSFDYKERRKDTESGHKLDKQIRKIEDMGIRIDVDDRW